ncbi:aspartate kinase [Candidatus Saccharibacteria bacterium]|nr:aspartate kinase [Candidatus Saccharibacteria bacterium]
MDEVRIMKFGGSSVGSAERILQVASVVKQYDDTPQVVVVSAVGGVTDKLVNIHSLAAKKDIAYKEVLQELKDQHIDIARSIAKYGIDIEKRIQKIFEELEQQAEQTARITNRSTGYDAIVSFGERLSVELVAAALESKTNHTQAISATELIRTNKEFTDAQPILEKTESLARARLLPLLRQGITPVVTGFIGATESGEVTTLGRGASDYTATILGYCLDASEVIIWTDVTGVMTADPRVIPDAQTIADLSYGEASELSYYGAKVLHPLTMIPASLKNIPIRIKNTFRLDAAGTRISSFPEQSNHHIKAVTKKSQLSVVSIHSSDYDGVTSVVSLATKLIVAHKITVYLMTQASHEGTVSFVISMEKSEQLVKLLNSDIKDGNITITIDNDVSIVAVVGDGRDVIPMAMGVIFSSLSAGGVSSRAVAQGHSGKSLSVVVKSEDELLAVRVLHQGLGLQLMNKRKA